VEQQEQDIQAESRLGDAMAALGPGARKLMELWLDGRSRAEIASETGLSADIVSELCVAAFRQLHELLAR
jgi:DNA-directed RNA polymerase specialized sigma24 family protein